MNRWIARGHKWAQLARNNCPDLLINIYSKARGFGWVWAGQQNYRSVVTNCMMENVICINRADQGVSRYRLDKSTPFAPFYLNHLKTHCKCYILQQLKCLGVFFSTDFPLQNSNSRSRSVIFILSVDRPRSNIYIHVQDNTMQTQDKKVYIRSCKEKTQFGY